MGNISRFFYFVLWSCSVGIFFVSDFAFPDVNWAIREVLALPVFIFFLFVLWEKVRNSKWQDCRFLFCNNNYDVERKSKIWLYLPIILFFYYAVFIILFNFTTNDTINQLAQVKSFCFSDWHPVAHTFMIWLLSCAGSSFILFLVLEAAVFVIINLAAYKVLVKYCNLKPNISLALCGFVALHPGIMVLLCAGWKDMAMALALQSCVICVIPVCCSQGAWLRKNYISFIVAFFCGTVFRHNAFFFTIPLLLTLFFWIKKEYITRYILVVATIIMLLLGYKITVKTFCPAQHNDLSQTETHVSQTYGETIGIPLNILASVAKNNPQALPPDARKFVEQIAPLEVWQKYEKGNANTIKYLCLADLQKALHNTPPKQFVKLVFSTVLADPANSFTGAYFAVDRFWKLNSWPGGLVLILLLAALWCLPVLKWKVLTVVLPVIAYQVGTSLLMYSRYDIRFYAYSITVCLPLTVLLLFQNKQKLNEPIIKDHVKEDIEES